jgi:hypothetical protein
MAWRSSQKWQTLIGQRKGGIRRKQRLAAMDNTSYLEAIFLGGTSVE